MNFARIIAEALHGLRRNLSMVISVILVTFVSLTFVGAAILMQGQIAQLRAFWEDQAQVQIFMCTPISTTAQCADGAASEEQINAVRTTLEGDTLGPLIANVTYLSPQDAYDELVESKPDYAGFIPPEQMPANFKVNLKDQTQTEVLTEAFHNTAGVEQVKNQMKYLDPLFQALTVATYLAVGIAVLMLIAAVLLIATTIRLSAYARRKEIGIMRLVGASNRFIQTPFILEGVVAAVVGAALASGAVLAGVHFGVNGYLKQRVTFTMPWVGMQEAWMVVPVLIGVGVILAALSAGFAIRRYLKG